MIEEAKNKEIVYDQEEIPDSGEAGLNQLTRKIKKIKEKLKKCQEEKGQYLDGWQRAKADLINYKRRQEEQMEKWQKLINEGLIVDLLPVLDSLELGIKNQESRELEIIKKQFLKILENHGLDEIKSKGEKFNPEFHEAVESVQSDKEEGRVVEEIQKGYTLNGEVIRTAKVKVSK